MMGEVAEGIAEWCDVGVLQRREGGECEFWGG